METLHEIKDSLVEWSIQILEQMGMLGLFLFSFTESLFHPVPVDPILIAMSAMGEWSMFNILFWASIIEFLSFLDCPTKILVVIGDRATGCVEH